MGKCKELLELNNVVFERIKGEDHEFGPSLGYILNLRLPWITLARSKPKPNQHKAKTLIMRKQPIKI